MPNYDGEMASFKDSTKNKIYEIVDKDARDRLDNLSSSDVAYDNTQTSLQADTVQEAIDTIVNTGAAIASAVTYDNTTSGLSASNVQDALDEVESEKVDKEAGKGLSTEDYTSSEKSKLSGIENGAEKNNVWFGKVRKATDYNGDLGFVIDTEVIERNDFRNGDILFLWFNDIDWSQLQLQNNYSTYLYFNEDPDTTPTPSTLRPYLVNRIIPDTSSQYIYDVTSLGNNNRWFAPRSLMTFVFRMDGGTEIGFVIQREMASTDHYGEVILSNGTGSSSEEMAATSKAVKDVMDFASAKQDPVVGGDNISIRADGKTIDADLVAGDTSYDRSTSGLQSTNVQDALDEVVDELGRKADTTTVANTYIPKTDGRGKGILAVDGKNSGGTSKIFAVIRNGSKAQAGVSTADLDGTPYNNGVWFEQDNANDKFGIYSNSTNGSRILFEEYYDSSSYSYKSRGEFLTKPTDYNGQMPSSGTSVTHGTSWTTLLSVNITAGTWLVSWAANFASSGGTNTGYRGAGVATTGDPFAYMAAQVPAVTNNTYTLVSGCALHVATGNQTLNLKVRQYSTVNTSITVIPRLQVIKIL